MGRWVCQRVWNEKIYIGNDRSWPDQDSTCQCSKLPWTFSEVINPNSYSLINERMDTQNEGPWKRWLLSNMAISGIYVKSLACNMVYKKLAWHLWAFGFDFFMWNENIYLGLPDTCFNVRIWYYYPSRLLWWGEDWARLPEALQRTARATEWSTANSTKQFLKICRLPFRIDLLCCLVYRFQQANMAFCWWNFPRCFRCFLHFRLTSWKPKCLLSLNGWFSWNDLSDWRKNWLGKSETRVTQVFVFNNWHQSNQTKNATWITEISTTDHAKRLVHKRKVMETCR